MYIAHVLCLICSLASSLLLHFVTQSLAQQCENIQFDVLFRPIKQLLRICYGVVPLFSYISGKLIKMTKEKKKFNWAGFVIEVVKLAIAFITGTQISNF